VSTFFKVRASSQLRYRLIHPSMKPLNTRLVFLVIRDTRNLVGIGDYEAPGDEDDVRAGDRSWTA
jgi:hypothetical protein